jgi:ethanolamine ammonia-lyase large subunit
LIWKTIFAASCWSLPMGVDVCYTNHAGLIRTTWMFDAAGRRMHVCDGRAGSDDIMLNYQNVFHDALARGARWAYGRRG